VRAEFEIPIYIFATISALAGIFRMLLVEIRSRPVNGLLAAIAHDQWLPLFDSEYRNKKQTEVVVGTLVIRLMQAANRASAWILIQDFYFG
jgi:glutamate formiminotransferase